MKYYVELKQTVIEAATVVVEAADEDEAERIALEQSEIDPEIVWNYDETTSPAEVVEITPSAVDTVLAE